MADRRTQAENRSINAMRTVAALAVVVGHLRVLVFRQYHDVPHSLINFFLYGITSLGHQAVVVFFVLSGFWVGGSVLRKVQRGAFSWPGYLNQRVTRLWVVLIPALVLTAVCDLIGRHLYGAQSTYQGVSAAAYGGVVTAQQPIGPLAFVGNALFLQNVRVTPYGTNGPLWSLSYEFWFYMLFPLVVLAVTARASRKAVLWWAIIAGVCLFIGMPLVSYFPMWCLGALVAANQRWIALWLSDRKRLTVAFLRGGAGIVLVGMALGVRGLNSLEPTLGDYLVAVPATVFLALLVTDVHPHGILSKLLDVLSVSAHRSYSLYAIHLPLVLLLVSAIGIDVNSRWPPNIMHGLMFLVLLMVPLAAAWVFAAATEMRTAQARAWVSRIGAGAGRRMLTWSKK